MRIIRRCRLASNDDDEPSFRKTARDLHHPSQLFLRQLVRHRDLPGARVAAKAQDSEVLRRQRNHLPPHSRCYGRYPNGQRMKKH
eukprot:4441366-Pleurochrysis_carterae.AAC.1